MSKETNLSVVEIQGVRCYIDKLGAAWINAEDAARGLGFVDVHLKKDFATSGEKYETVRWARVNDYLREFGYDKEVGKDDFIPESIFYLLAMKANNEAAKNFQRKIAFEILPSLRKYGYYAMPGQKRKSFDSDTQDRFDELQVRLLSLSIEIEKITKERDRMNKNRYAAYANVLSKLIDFVEVNMDKLTLAVESDDTEEKKTELYLNLNITTMNIFNAEKSFHEADKKLAVLKAIEDETKKQIEEIVKNFIFP